MKYLILLASLVAYGEPVNGYLTCSVLEGTGKISGVDNQPLVKGAVFKPDSKVATDAKSTANIYLSNGSKLILNPDSVVHFKTLKQEDGSQQKTPEDNKSMKETGASVTEIEVESGKVIGDVKKLYSGSVFTLKTPVGVVSIKGTVFSVAYQQNKDGTASFSVGCLVGRVQVQMADPRVAPISIPAGKQLTMTALPTPTAPPPPPKANGEEKKEGDKPADKPRDEEAPPPPPMKIQVEALPPAEMKQMAFARPEAPMAPPPPPPPQPANGSTVDNLINQLNRLELSEQVTNPSPTGG
jgi:hypothetical protein